MTVSAQSHLRSGVVIPAHPLALTADRTLDGRRQRALTRYYMDAGAGGIAVGVHTTQFAIRDARHGMYRPVLALAAATAREELASRPRPFVLVAGLCGSTGQALAEAQLAESLGYDVGLLSLGALAGATDAQLIAHCRTVAQAIPLFGFYLQPAVGGRLLGYDFWRAFSTIENVWAVKIAPFNRYATLEVVRAIMDAGRDDIALYTGNDDNIVGDLVTPLPVPSGLARPPRFIDGGLLGQWAVWTRRAVELLDRVKVARSTGRVDAVLLQEGAALTDANGTIFDQSHAFAGCIPGIHEVLRRQGLLAGTWCLSNSEVLSEGQEEEIDRTCRAYPFLHDDEFVSRHRDHWMR